MSALRVAESVNSERYIDEILSRCRARHNSANYREAEPA